MRRNKAAFTLVELLVVVSIIALLISILLPSLQRARDQAKQVKCMAHQSGLAKAALTYASEENEWIIGSPGTSGSALLGKDWGAPNEVNIPRNPVQSYDWAGPLAAVQMGMSLPPNRAQRWKEVTTKGTFVCPSNRFVAPPFNDSSGNFETQKLVSYNMMRNMLWWENQNDAPKFAYTGVTIHRTIGDQTELARGFRPQLERLGNPSEKVFLSDGSRYTTEDGEIDFDVDWAANFGGAFADGGPTVQPQYTRSYCLDEPAKFFSYRHRKGRKSGTTTQSKGDNSNGLVVSYWDNHAEWMTAAKSRLPNRWWPKGTKVSLLDLNQRSISAMIESVGNNPSAFLALFVNNKYEIRR